tara:strand:- start:666 stop:1010 length:345 start_codon:yes stop_codon:yes gene_type:complete
MEELPSDMINEIITHVKSNQDIVNFSLVCRDFRERTARRRSAALLDFHIASNFDTGDNSRNIKEFLTYCSEFFEYPRRPRHRNMGKRVRRSMMKLWWVSNRGSRTIDALLPTMW